MARQGYQTSALIPRPKRPTQKQFLKPVHFIAGGAAVFVALAFLMLPTVVGYQIEQQVEETPKTTFTVTVDPERKIIIEDPEIEALLAEEPTSLVASVGSLDWIIRELAARIAELPVYGMIAGADQRLVTIYPGYREEEVVAAFGNALKWTQKERAAFLKQLYQEPPSMEEGQFRPGTYPVSTMMSEDQIQVLLYDRFEKEILARYSTTTAERVPVRDALIIASLIEREAGGWHDMREISGILWNRQFKGMNLQIDATLQYAKATGKNGEWWPQPLPKDKFIKSKYNTYQHPGLPPGAISNPSIAAIVAALNPKKTDCLFYFHDDYGRFHCSPDYEGHVKKLREIYGRGK